jgi:hypothetical protein
MSFCLQKYFVLSLAFLESRHFVRSYIAEKSANKSYVTQVTMFLGFPPSPQKSNLCLAFIIHLGAIFTTLVILSLVSIPSLMFFNALIDLAYVSYEETGVVNTVPDFDFNEAKIFLGKIVNLIENEARPLVLNFGSCT